MLVESRCRAVRRLLIGTFTSLLVGCGSIPPSEVKIRLNSDQVLGVSEFKFEPATRFSGCTVSGQIKYDIAIEPNNFTGIVFGEGMIIEYGGKWRAEPRPYQLIFRDGKQIGEGIDIFEYGLSDDGKEKRESLCASKSSSDIKLISLGQPAVAVAGIKALLKDNK